MSLFIVCLRHQAVYLGARDRGLSPDPRVAENAVPSRQAAPRPGSVGLGSRVLGFRGVGVWGFGFRVLAQAGAAEELPGAGKLGFRSSFICRGEIQEPSFCVEGEYGHRTVRLSR